jgi:hypothetical protein
MSMIGNYKRLSEDRLNELLAKSETIMDFLYPDDDPTSELETDLDIDKTWQAIHFLLTGDAWKGLPPLANAALGGTELGEEDVGYGPARYLSVSEVAEVAAHLSVISKEELISRFNLNQFREREIYPDGWVGSDEEMNYITGYYLKLVSFFQDASKSNSAMLLYLN